MTRRRLVPTSLLSLLTLGLVALAPSAGIRVHRHADDGPAHVHFEDLLGGSSSRDAATRSAAAPASHRGARDASPARPIDLLGASPPFSAGPLGLETVRIFSSTPTAARADDATLHGPLDAAHAHASSPFLRTIPAALVCWVVATFVLATRPDGSTPWPLQRVRRARARSPPLASRPLRAI